MDHKIIPVKIIPVATSHADELSALAKNIYKEYYLHLWYPGGADWYMNEYAYHPNTLKAELADTGNLHFIVYEGEQPVGYMKIRMDAILPGTERAGSLEIERIYLHKKAAGNGIGKKLMQLAEKTAVQNNKKIIFLKAMDSSKDAIAFYKKMGYVVSGTLTLPFPQMKEILRGMVILKKELLM